MSTTLRDGLSSLGASQPAALGLHPPGPHRRGQGRFLISFVLGAAIALAPLVFVSLRFGQIGEFDLFDSDASLSQEVLHGPISEFFPEYKLRMAKLLSPRLLVLGSSRVMQFQQRFFDGCSSRSCVYNAGGAAVTMKSGEEFFRQVASVGAPGVLLLGLDIWQFNPNDPQNTHTPVELTPSSAERLRRPFGLLRQFVPRLVDDPELRSLVAGAFTTPGYRGARAILRGEGFRPDGSYAYGDQFVSLVQGQSLAERSDDALQRIADSCCRLERFSRADPTAIQELQQLLATARSAGTQVIAFTLPFTDAVIDAVQRDDALRSGFDDVESQLASTFAKNGVPYLSFTRPSNAGCTSAEMLDGFHASEVCAARILDRLLSSEPVGRVLSPFVSDMHLRATLASRESDIRLGAP